MSERPDPEQLPIGFSSDSARRYNPEYDTWPAGGRSLKCFRRPWWSKADDAIVQAWHAIEAIMDGRDAHPRYGPSPEIVEDDSSEWQDWYDKVTMGMPWDELTCRRCCYWASDDGVAGECQGPELACGRTAESSTCEQWSPYTKNGATA